MADQQRLTNTLIELIKIYSPSGEEDAMDFAVSRKLGFLSLEMIHDSYKNAIAKRPGAGQPLLLSAHLDTVEPGRGIKPIVDSDILRPDCSTILGGDCKAGVAIVLEVLAGVQESCQSNPGGLGRIHLPRRRRVGGSRSSGFRHVIGQRGNRV